jgi:hypothetical protein
MSAPELQNQSPAADSVGNAPGVSVSVDVVDDDGDLTASSVRVYINNTLALFGSTVLPGFAGAVIATTGPDGVTVTLAPADEFEPGEQVVRVVAVDDASNALDEQWVFVTAATAAVAESDDTAAEDTEQQVGFDLYLDTSHDLEVAEYDLRLVAGADEVAQHLVVGLRLFLGEWYLDEDAGVPYYRDVLIGAPNSRVIEGLFRQHLLADADVESLTSFLVSIDRATRSLDVTFVAASSVGVVDVAAVFP